MKRSSWSDYQKEIADDKYYYVPQLHPSELFSGQREGVH